ncbi:DUF6300 family protein [Streptomyces sp. NPDC056337]|uniref:DUF6300 family protein n=1 Tax=Streptomyces sp. NPDC056337 TaxID=3345787 RepID=UPI0035D8917D
MTDSSEADEIGFQIDEVPPCTRCGGEALLRVRFAHSWKNTGGALVEGLQEAELCAGCDRGEASADELLALVAVDHRLDLANVAEFGGILTAWVEAVRQRSVDTYLLNEQHKRWLRGEL